MKKGDPTSDSQIWAMDEEEQQLYNQLNSEVCLSFNSPATTLMPSNENSLEGIFVDSDVLEITNSVERDLILNHVETLFTAAGFREGMDETEDKLLQFGFDVGFVNGCASGARDGIERGISTALHLYMLSESKDPLTLVSPHDHWVLALSMASHTAAGKKLDEPEPVRYTQTPIPPHASLESYISELENVKSSRPGVPMASIGSYSQTKKNTTTIAESLGDITKTTILSTYVGTSAADISPDVSIKNVSKSNCDILVSKELRRKTQEIVEKLNSISAFALSEMICPLVVQERNVEDIIKQMHVAQKKYEKEITETGICGCDHNHGHEHGDHGSTTYEDDDGFM